MFCHNCGTSLDEGVKFCPNCGAPVAMEGSIPEAPAYEEPAYEQPVYEEPVYEQPAAPVYEQPVYREPVVNEEAEALSTPILVFGILGLAFACVPYINFLGIIFSAIAKGKVRQFLNAGGVLTGKARVGKILATVGLIVGIVFTAIFAIVIFMAIINAISNGGSGFNTRIYW